MRNLMKMLSSVIMIFLFKKKINTFQMKGRKVAFLLLLVILGNFLSSFIVFEESNVLLVEVDMLLWIFSYFLAYLSTYRNL